MNTMKIVCLSLMTGIVLLSACKKDEFETSPAFPQQSTELRSVIPGPLASPLLSWRDDFTSAASLNSNWFLYGNPKPRFVNYAGNRFGLFDNNGNSPSGSCALSKVKIGDGHGYSIESDVLIDITKGEAGIICPEIGVSRHLSTGSDAVNAEAGISMKLMFVGPGTANIQPAYQDQLYLVLTTLNPDGTFTSTGDPRDETTAATALKVDVDRNGWHKMKIVVTSSKQVAFYLDNKFVWSPKKPIDPSLMINKNVLLGYTSPGTTGKAYHDFVKVTYPISPAIQSVQGDEARND